MISIKLLCSIVEIAIQHGCSPAAYFQNTFSYEHLWMAASVALFYVSLRWMLLSIISNMGRAANMSAMMEKIRNKLGLKIVNFHLKQLVKSSILYSIFSEPRLIFHKYPSNHPRVNHARAIMFTFPTDTNSIVF